MWESKGNSATEQRDRNKVEDESADGSEEKRADKKREKEISMAGQRNPRGTEQERRRQKRKFKRSGYPGDYIGKGQDKRERLRSAHILCLGRGAENDAGVSIRRKSRELLNKEQLV